MEKAQDIKALFIIINAGYTDEVVDIARGCGAGGVTIINSRGEGALHKSFMGITIESEKEILLTLVNKETAVKIMREVKEKAGLDTPAHSICFTMPVEKMTEINTHASDIKTQKKK